MSVDCFQCDDIISADEDAENIVTESDTDEVYMRQFVVESTDAYTMTATAYYCCLDCLVEDQGGDSE